MRRCLRAGTIQHVHQGCLDTWRTARQHGGHPSDTCEVCGASYQVRTRQPLRMPAAQTYCQSCRFSWSQDNALASGCCCASSHLPGKYALTLAAVPQQVHRQATTSGWLPGYTCVKETVSNTVYAAAVVGLLAVHGIKEMVKPTPPPPPNEIFKWLASLGALSPTCHAPAAHPCFSGLSCRAAHMHCCS